VHDARGAQDTAVIGGEGVEVVDRPIELVHRAEARGQDGIGNGLERDR